MKQSLFHRVELTILIGAVEHYRQTKAPGQNAFKILDALSLKLQKMLYEVIDEKPPKEPM